MHENKQKGTRDGHPHIHMAIGRKGSASSIPYLQKNKAV